MLNNKLFVFILSLLLINTLYAANVENIEPSTGETVSTVDTGTSSENAPQTSNPESQNGTETVQNKQPRTEADELRESRSKWKPLPGSHYDENYRVIIDDPEVYQKALEKEQPTQPKRVKSKQEALNASRAKWKPLPGSHFDENYHVIIDDPEVYQKALEKEQSTQTKQQKTMDDLINEALANSKPTPGSHYDENWRVVIDDPEVYQKALEKERARNKGKFDYQHPSTPQEEDRGPLGIFYKVYKYNPILGVLFFIFVAFLAIVCLSIRDSFKKPKRQ